MFTVFPKECIDLPHKPALVFLVRFPPVAPDESNSDRDELIPFLPVTMIKELHFLFSSKLCRNQLSFAGNLANNGCIIGYFLWTKQAETGAYLQFG
jgi:hypothetical protein